MKNNYPLFFIIFSIITFLSFSNDGYSKLINVPDEYSNIQAALNSAAEGDSVQVAPGIYNENIVWPNLNGIKLMGSGEDSCQIKGVSDEAVLIIGNANGNDITINSETEISGFTISNGKNGGVRCFHSSPYLSNLIIQENLCGIYCYHSSPTLFNIKIIDNYIYNG